MGCGSARNKELATVRVWPAVGHGQESRAVVFVDKVFVGKGGTVDAEFPGAWQAKHSHKVVDSVQKKRNRCVSKK